VDGPLFYGLGAAAVLALGILGSRGLIEIRDALRLAEFDRLAAVPRWSATRALLGMLFAVPPLFVLASRGAVAAFLGLGVAAAGYWLAPRLLLSARRRAERQVLDALPLHLELMALALEAGSAWPGALMACIERAPEGPLRRAWQRVLLEIHAGAEPLDALKHLEQRVRLPAFATLVSALRAAEKMQLPAAGVVRDRARQAAAAHFARAEREARAAPLKLWAVLLLCLAPCTLAVLVFPVAELLAAVVG
jgi:tight adherence protein C